MSMPLRPRTIIAANRPKTTMGESSVARPRGVRSASRNWLSATADDAADEPGTRHPDDFVDTVREPPTEPGELSTRAKARRANACRAPAVTARVPREPRAAGR